MESAAAAWPKVSPLAKGPGEDPECRQHREHDGEWDVLHLFICSLRRRLNVSWHPAATQTAPGVTI